jgi:serine protease Do
MTRSAIRALVAAAVLWPFNPLWTLANAQRPATPPAPAPAPRIAIMPRGMATLAPSTSRAALGVGLRTGSRADTLGLEITEVTPDGPAAKAGLTDGMRIEAINGVSLRLSAADANDPLTADAGYRRLQRVMAEVEPGDTVELRVLEGTSRRTVSVATVSNAELARARAVTVSSNARVLRETMANRAALGIGVSSSGNARDTLGVFITSVTTKGPADSAGVIEGERIAAVNGVDVRVPPEDAGDERAGAARVNRLMRTIEALAPGDRVTLRVFGGGRYREVQVTAGKASEVGGGPRVLRLPGLEGMVWRDFADNQTPPFRVY